MIGKNSQYLCTEFWKIENYDKAVNDKENIWEIHHRRETSEGITKEELKAIKQYYHRPPEELIFLTRKEHRAMHASINGSNRSPETLKKLSDVATERYKDPEERRKQSERAKEQWAKRRANGTAKWSKNLNN